MRSYLSSVTVLLVALCASFVAADVSHLGYNRNRPSSTRLQRLENSPTPYPAAGFRPNREFNLPRELPLFPLGNQQPQDNTQNNNGGFDVLSEPQQPQQPQQPQRPQLTYGAPARFRQAPARLQQQPQRLYNAPQAQENSQIQPQSPSQSQPQPTNNIGFENQAEPQTPGLLYGAPAAFRQSPARLQLQPQRLYNAPQSQENTQIQPQSQSQPQPQAANNIGFENQAEPQTPGLLYGAPAALRQAPARLQQQPQLQQLYITPQSQRLTAAQPARLTDNREDKEDEEDSSANNAEASTDIDNDNKKEDAKKADIPQNVAIAYYPAGAFSFVQPLSAAYVAPNTNAAYVAAGTNAAYVTASGIYQSPYVAASSFVQQPFSFAAPAQLQAW